MPHDLADNVEITTAASPAVTCKESGGGSTTSLTHYDEGAGAMKSRASNSAGAVTWDLDAIASDGSSNALMRLFRATSTSGLVQLQIFKGDGTASATFIINAKTGAITQCGGVDVLDGKYESSQTTAPTATLTSTTLNDGAGSGAAIAVTAGSTDNAGSITITAGNGTPGAGIAGQIVFNAAYGAAPRAVILQAKDADAVDLQVYVSALSTTSFQVSLNTAMAASEVAEWYYWVIG